MKILPNPFLPFQNCPNNNRTITILFSDLPDSDANTQVLLLGITRFDTTPSPPQPLHSPKFSTKSKPKRPHTYHFSETEAYPDYNAAHGSGIFRSIENLDKTTGCFHLEKKSKLKEKQLIDKPAKDFSSEAVPENQVLCEKQSKSNFNTLFGRFQRNFEKNSNKISSSDSHNTIDIERKSFYRWLDLSRHKHDDRAELVANAENWQSQRAPVIVKRLKKSCSTRRKVAKRSPKTGRFSSCIPYCVAGARNDNSSSAVNSLASSFRNSKNRDLKTTQNQVLAAGNYLMQSNCIPINCNRNNNNNNNNNNSTYSNNKNNNRRHNDNENNYIRSNNNSNLFNNLNIMDRSVDSIGSCSLDVDAESTDFSDTSGSLNVCTPLSGKDFTHEFTSRIHERCQLPIHHHQPAHQQLQQPAQPQQQLQHQQIKSILDPNSGKVSTILSQNVRSQPTINSPTSPVKKPSYLNLACCVNGYSNLTTYDSKFRQSINKSREVSPIRPITHTIQYNRSGDSNYLGLPIAIPINDNTKNYMMDAHTILSPEKRYFTQTQQKSIEMNGSSGRDVTDNINSNGCVKFIKKTILHTSTTTTTTAKNNGSNTNCTGGSSTFIKTEQNSCDAVGAKSSSKSFIQQRVERLYGPTALAQGLYSPKKPKSADECQSTATTMANTTTVLVEKSQNSSNTLQSTKFVLEAQRNGLANILSNNRAAHNAENVNVDGLNEALPVLRHLRPEFRAQLPTLSPKRSIAITKLSSSPICSTSTTHHINGSTNGTFDDCNNTNSFGHIIKPLTNGTDATASVNCELQQQQQSQHAHCDSNGVRTIASSSPALNDVKNSCLTSNKSHDIENECRHNQFESHLNNGSYDTSTVQTALTETINSVQKLQLNDINDKNQGSTESTMNGQHLKNTETPMDANSGVLKRKTSADLATAEQNSSATVSVPIKIATDVERVDANGNHKTEQTKDALRFLKTVHVERDRLINLAVVAEKELEELIQKGDVDEDVLGYLRSAAGKARLLATKKFKQFEGLCNDCLNQTTHDMPPPTPEDLQGFWDMVLLQVENVDSLYAELDTMRANGWQKPPQAKPKPPQGAKLAKRPPTATTVSSKISASASTSSSAGPTSTVSETQKKSATAIAVAQKREAQRKQFMEMKRKNKLAMTATADPTKYNAQDVVIVDKVSSNNASSSSGDGKILAENETDR